MALGDITLYRDGAFGAQGAHFRQVASGTTASINSGELVLTTLNQQYVTVWTASNTAKPVVGTDYVAGLATTTSDETATLAGKVAIMKIVPGQGFLIKPTTAATYGVGTTPSQTTYNSLVGRRVLLNTTSAGVQTILSTDGSTNGLTVEDLDISKYPGMVAFSVRTSASVYN